MGNTIYYAATENIGANTPTFYAGKAQSIDLCSVSACFPHVIVYPEQPYAPASGDSGLGETGSITCPASPSVDHPCTITVNVKVADVGSPTTSSLLEEVGAYFRSTSIDAQIFDEGTSTLTVFGSGTNAGHAVTFTMVAVDNGTAAGTFSLALSDGYTVAGTLISGAIHLF